MSEQHAGTDPVPTGPPRRQRTGWLLGALAATVAVGLSVAALVVALNRSTPSATTAVSGTQSCSATEVARSELPSVVTIQVSAGDTGGTGSGEVIDTDGHILTNNHVIAAAATGGTITVVFADGRKETAKLVGRDPQTDIAVLQVADRAGLKPITFGSSADLEVGQPVIALGAPLGLSSTVTSGIVSALDRSVNVPSDEGTTAVLVAAIQTDAAINPGNSGGALVDCSGDLVGIPSAGASVPSAEGGSSAGNIGIGFAIPSDFAKMIGGELIANGRVSHGVFGVTVTTFASDQGQAEPPAGLYITSVTAGGPAERAGLRTGDVITKIGDTPATSAEQLLAATLANRPGDTVSLTYRRNGAEHQAQVTLGAK
ncbi:MAG TPA: trypsin-like peptidase domain-containing protein [Micromonosporaceae bacterium]|jgi:putative serine protease PepD